MSGRRHALLSLDALSALLRKEIAAIQSGAFAELVQYSDEKARLGAALEEQLQIDPDCVDEERLRALNELILRNRHHLEVAQNATAEMIREVADLRERHSISGVYGRHGARRDALEKLVVGLDKSF